MEDEFIDLTTALKTTSTRPIIVFGNAKGYNLEPGYQALIDKFVEICRHHGIGAYSNQKQYNAMCWNPDDPSHAPYTHQNARKLEDINARWHHRVVRGKA